MYQQFEISQISNLLNLASEFCPLSQVNSLLSLLDLSSIQSYGVLFVATLRLFRASLQSMKEEDAVFYAVSFLSKPLPVFFGELHYL